MGPGPGGWIDGSCPVKAAASMGSLKWAYTHWRTGSRHRPAVALLRNCEPTTSEVQPARAPAARATASASAPDSCRPGPPCRKPRLHRPVALAEERALPSAPSGSPTATPRCSVPSSGPASPAAGDHTPVARPVALAAHRRSWVLHFGRAAPCEALVGPGWPRHARG